MATSSLCAACDKLDFGTLITHETNSRCIGNLAEYHSLECPFCRLIRQAICHSWEEAGDDGWKELYLSTASPANSYPPCRLYIQSHSALTVHTRSGVQHPEPRLLLAVDRRPTSVHPQRAAIREVDKVKNRFIIAELESFDLPRPYVPRRAVEERIHIPLVRSWLTRCQKYHRHPVGRTLSSTDLFSPNHPFRLIDTFEECLVCKSEPVPYAALSYVWGVTKTLRCLLSNVASLEKPGSLACSTPATSHTVHISRTAHDSIQLARRLGLRYLWIDALCIVQDSLDDIKRLIHRMDDVYGGAEVTFVAVAGSDADDCLPGVIQPRTGHPLVGDSVGALTLSPVLSSLCTQVRTGPWNTRGWTFQEQALSRRCLYFTENEAFFNCSTAQWREGYNDCEASQGSKDDPQVRLRTGPPWWNAKIRNDPDPTPYRHLGTVDGLKFKEKAVAYQKAVQDYSRRSLTKSDDVLNAFAGVFQCFDRYNDNDDNGFAPELRITQTQGIPATVFCQALLWFPSDTAVKRRASIRTSSWSWISWEGPIEFIFADSTWLSRNLSYAAIKPVPLYSTISGWHFGSPGPSYIWKDHSQWEPLSKTDKEFIQTNTAIDMIQVQEKMSPEPPEGFELLPGDLGFAAPSLDSDQFRIATDSSLEHASSLALNTAIQKGQFRFDDPFGEQHVDTLVAVTVGNTITNPPDVFSILIGLSAREDGASRRVGIGYIYYLRDKKAPRPQWDYGYFKLV